MMSVSGFVRAAAVLGALALTAVLPARATADTPPRVDIVTSRGDIVVVLDPAHAPKTVANFLHYVDAKFYDGGTFFRAVPGFVIQGGNRSREGASDAMIPLETPLKTGILNKDGAISMARTSDPDSATSEFFLCDGDQPALDGTPSTPGYAAFGHVVSGMNVVRQISHQPTQGEQLVAPVTIIKIVRLP